MKNSTFPWTRLYLASFDENAVANMAAVTRKPLPIPRNRGRRPPWNFRASFLFHGPLREHSAGNFRASLRLLSCLCLESLRAGEPANQSDIPCRAGVARNDQSSGLCDLIFTFAQLPKKLTPQKFVLKTTSKIPTQAGVRAGRPRRRRGYGRSCPVEVPSPP